MVLATYKDLCIDAVDPLREPDDEIGRHVLGDPHGNELCAFVRP